MTAVMVDSNVLLDLATEDPPLVRVVGRGSGECG